MVLLCWCLEQKSVVRGSIQDLMRFLLHCSDEKEDDKPNVFEGEKNLTAISVCS